MVVPGGSILLYPLTTPTWHLAWLHWVYASTYDSWWQYKMFTNIRLAGVVHAPACISATPSTPAKIHHFMYIPSHYTVTTMPRLATRHSTLQPWDSSQGPKSSLSRCVSDPVSHSAPTCIHGLCLPTPSLSPSNHTP